MLLHRAPATPTELICFAEKGREWMGRVRDWYGWPSQVMLLGLRAGTTVVITDMAIVRDMAHNLEAAGGAVRPAIFTQGCRRGYAHALEQHTPYRHLGWLEHIRSDDPIAVPSEKRIDAFNTGEEWLIYDTKQHIYPLILYTSRKRKKTLQLRAFEIRRGEAVEVPIQGSATV